MNFAAAVRSNLAVVKRRMFPAEARLASSMCCDVIIPYHHENLPWVRESVESILNQNGVECIVHLIADGFTAVDDPVLDLSRHPQVRWYRNDSVIGPYRSVHRIFQFLESDFIALQDSDDIALPFRIRRAIEALCREEAELYGAAMRQFVSFEDSSPELHQLSLREPIFRSGPRTLWCPEGRIVNGTMVIRKRTFQYLNGFMPLRGGADAEFATRARRAGVRVFCDSEIVGLRRLHSGSLSSSADQGAGSPARNQSLELIRKSYQSMKPGFDPKLSGGLSWEFAEYSHIQRITQPPIRMRDLEMHVAHACNLSCEHCSHYSNYHHKGVLSVEQAGQQMQLWSSRLYPEMFSLLGGEPALNPELCDIIMLARQYWPYSRLRLISNGFLLARHSRLPEVLEQAGMSLEISVHHQSPDYLERLKPVRALVAEWQQRNSFEVKWRPSSQHWRRIYQGQGSQITPYTDRNQRQSWESCPSRSCMQLYQGKLWKCPQLAYLPMQAEKLNLHDRAEWKPYLGYVPLGAETDQQSLSDFVDREDEFWCRMCPSQREPFELANPLARGKP